MSERMEKAIEEFGNTGQLVGPVEIARLYKLCDHTREAVAHRYEQLRSLDDELETEREHLQRDRGNLETALQDACCILEEFYRALGATLAES